MTRPHFACVWAAAAMLSATVERDAGGSGFLCIGCIEARLGRTLCKKDFVKVPVNALSDPNHTPRLRNRLRSTRSRPAKKRQRKRWE